MMYDGELLMQKKDLIAAGWTPTALKQFVGEPVVFERWLNCRRRVISHYYSAKAVLQAAQEKSCRDYFAGVEARRQKRQDNLPVEIDLLDATREASRSAHRWRDRASDRWESGSPVGAGNASVEKRRWYELKERGIIALHRAGRLRYAGVSPQGMAIYEYGDGGLQCLHSTLHPVGAERKPVIAHPEVLFVPAKKQELRLMDVEYTLDCLFRNTDEYERSTSPERKRERTTTCFRCGNEGHIARECR